MAFELRSIRANHKSSLISRQADVSADSWFRLGCLNATLVPATELAQGAVGEDSNGGKSFKEESWLN